VSLVHKPIADTRAHRARFGLLVSATSDLGEEIQSIAALQQLPTVHEVIDRDAPRQLRHPTRTIWNGCFTRGVDVSPCNRDNLLPLLISVHIRQNGGSSDTDLLTASEQDFLEQNGPVGCRDLATLELLKAYGIPAYFSGCLTLTLPQYSGHRSDDVTSIDVPPLLFERLEPEAKEGVTLRRETTHTIPGLSISGKFRFRRIHQFVAARRLLRALARSRLVVTTSLPAALSATALGTPAILLMPNPRDGQFAGLSDLVYAIPLQDALEDTSLINLNETRTKGLHLALAEDLENTCREFIFGTADSRQAVGAR